MTASNFSTHNSKYRGGRFIEVMFKIKGSFKAKKGAFRRKKVKTKKVLVSLDSEYTSGYTS